MHCLASPCCFTSHCFITFSHPLLHCLPLSLHLPLLCCLPSPLCITLPSLIAFSHLFPLLQCLPYLCCLPLLYQLLLLNCIAFPSLITLPCPSSLIALPPIFYCLPLFLITLPPIVSHHISSHCHIRLDNTNFLGPNPVCLAFGRQKMLPATNRHKIALCISILIFFLFIKRLTQLV